MRTELEALDEELAMLFAEMFAITARALAKLAELDRMGGAPLGYQSIPHYLNYRVGLSLAAGREHLRVARALEALPRVREQFAAGALSYSKVRAITRVATPETEENYLIVAADTTASQLEKIVRGCQRVTLEQARKQLELRSVETGFGDDGMFTLRARLTPEEGARLMHALDGAVPTGGEHDRRGWAERRADALLALVGGTPAEVDLVVHVEQAAMAMRGDASAESADSSAEQSCQVETPRGERVAIASETARRLGCDASVVVMTHGPDAAVLDVGRRTRQIPTALRRALASRDGGCRYPGCSNFIVDRHHVINWIDGGETKLSNLIQVCSLHHARLHEGGFRVELAPDGTASFFDARGSAIAATCPLPRANGQALVNDTTGAPVTLVPWPGPPWYARKIDYSYVVSVLVSPPAHAHCQR